MRLPHVLSTVLIVSAATAAWAADKPAAPPLEVIELAVTPAAAPQPALKYRLLPNYLERTPGSAVPMYAKAFVLLADKKLQDDKTWEKIHQWLQTPVEKLPKAEVRATLDSFANVLREVDIAARRQRCDWDPPVQEEGENLLGLLLPELQTARNAARVVALRTRLHVADKKFDDALYSLRTGYGMARHIGQQPFLVSSLVGVAIAWMTTDQLRALQSAPGAPNVYWAITELPRPFIDLGTSIELEGAMLYSVCPAMHPARRRDLRPEQADAVLAKIASVLASAEGTAAGAVKFKDLYSPQRLAAIAADAKAELIASGHPQSAVEGMSASQAVALRMFEVAEAQRDELFKWFAVPYWQAAPEMERAASHVKNASKHAGLRVLPELLLPALNRAYSSTARAERYLAAVRCIEALRLHAATHGGKWPAALDEIRAVPVPINPVTGKPFGYRLEGDTAVLDAQGERPQQFRVTLRR